MTSKYDLEIWPLNMTSKYDPQNMTLKIWALNMNSKNDPTMTQKLKKTPQNLKGIPSNKKSV